MPLDNRAEGPLTPRLDALGGPQYNPTERVTFMPVIHHRAETEQVNRGQGDVHGTKAGETRHPLSRASPHGGTQDMLLPRRRTVATPVTCPH